MLPAWLLFISCVACKPEEMVMPAMSVEETKQAVLGTWKIERIEYKLCRSGNCSTNNYTGSSGDVFEFRADSAFLEQNITGKQESHSNFKADYAYPGAFILIREFWSATYEVKSCSDTRLVLTCSYTGNDPLAKFTDVYYLYR